MVTPLGCAFFGHHEIDRRRPIDPPLEIFPFEDRIDRLPEPMHEQMRFGPKENDRPLRLIANLRSHGAIRPRFLFGRNEPDVVDEPADDAGEQQGDKETRRQGDKETTICSNSWNLMLFTDFMPSCLPVSLSPCLLVLA